MAQRKRLANLAGWKNRIVGEGVEEAGQLLANPQNWRIHPKEQQKALAGILDEVGWVQRVLVNRQTGHVVDGHLRVHLALAQGDETPVPVVYVDLSPEEEALILATLDPLAAMAVTDQAKLDALLAEVTTDNAAVAELLGELASAGTDGESPDDIEDVSPDLPGAMALKRDMQFFSTLPWDIPEIREDMLGELSGLPLKAWAGPDVSEDDGATQWLYQWRSDSIRGLPWDRAILGFYVDDFRFEPLWAEPDVYVAKMLNLGVPTAVAPNFSLWHGSAQAVHLWNTFRSRWLARYFQEAGIRVIPDVNWADERSLDFCLLGIPVGAPVVAVQLQTVRKPEEIARAEMGFKRKVMTVFSPGSIVRCRNRDWVLLPSDQPDLRLLRPLTGAPDEVAGVHVGLSNLIGATLPTERLTSSWAVDSGQIARWTSAAIGATLGRS